VSIFDLLPHHLTWGQFVAAVCLITSGAYIIGLIIGWTLGTLTCDESRRVSMPAPAPAVPVTPMPSRLAVVHPDTKSFWAGVIQERHRS
jgi:hypothetical protein